MDLWSTALFSVLLLAAAAGLMVSHTRTWRAAQADPVEPKELRYRQNQFRRRMQTSAMLGVLGAAIFIGYVLTPWIGSKLFAMIYWGAVLLLVLWMALLAVADMVATKFHFTRLKTDYMVEQAKLRAEMRKIQSVEGNGKKQ